MLKRDNSAAFRLNLLPSLTGVYKVSVNCDLKKKFKQKKSIALHHL